MQFKKVIGQEAVKEKLRKSIAENRVAHTQLFLGPEGCGSLPLAIAFAQYINCHHKENGDSCGKCSSCVKYQAFAHPDLHFIFPTITSENIKKPKSEFYLTEWRNYLIKTKGYISQSGWYDEIGLTGNKQGTIYARDASDIMHILSVKSYEADYKVVIVYLPEKLNATASNKLLKTLEEPPENSLILMVAERYDLLLPTIRSRAQLLKILPIKEEALLQAMVNNEAFDKDKKILSRLASLSNGNWNKVWQLSENREEEEYNFLKFRDWMRLCFKPDNYIELTNLSKELARLPREKQKKLLSFGLQVIHNTMLSQAQLDSKIRAASEEADYINKFAPFINEANREAMYQMVNESIYHLERNANANILFGNLSLQMVQLLNRGKKAAKR